MKKAFTLLCLLTISGCASSTGSDESATVAELSMPPQPTGKTLVFECGDYEFLARTGPGELAVWLHDRYLVLGQVRAASGSKYEGDGVTVWMKGEEALLEDRGSRWDRMPA